MVVESDNLVVGSDTNNGRAESETESKSLGIFAEEVGVSSSSDSCCLFLHCFRLKSIEREMGFFFLFVLALFVMVLIYYGFITGTKIRSILM